MKEKIVLGKINGVHGIKGELKVYPLTDDISRFNKLSYVFIDDKEYTVTSVRTHMENVLLTLEEIKDRTSAEKLKNKFISVKREDAVSLKEGEYFIEDLKGLKAINEDGKEVGILNDVLCNSSVHNYEFKNGKYMLLLPAVKENILSVNIEEGFMVIREENGVSYEI